MKNSYHLNMDFTGPVSILVDEQQWIKSPIYERTLTERGRRNLSIGKYWHLPI